MSDLSGQTLGEFTLHERIGRGGMSEVYRATAANNQEVAVKILKPDSEEEEYQIVLERFHMEARIITELNHPHILPIIAYSEENGYVYLATPLIDGGTLADQIRLGPLTLPEARRMLDQIGSALDHAHRLQVIHRDLKPSNVLLDGQGQAFLTDFGIAKITTISQELTETGNVIGTPAYMAPEQWRAEPLDARTDVYGLGVMLFLMLTTRTPFEADTAHAIMYRHLDQPVPSLSEFVPDIPKAVDEVVQKALAKYPDDRYPSSGEFAADFGRALDGQRTIAQTYPPRSISPISSNDVVGVPPPPPPPIYGSYNTRRYAMPKRVQSNERGGFWLGIGFIFLVVVGVFASGLFILNSNFFANGESDDAPTNTPRLADAPRVRIVDPSARAATVNAGETLRIEITAFDQQGVTRAILRWNGITIQSADVDNPDGVSPFNTTFTYTPTETGQYLLEVIAFRGDDIQSDPQVITVTVP